jgi:hypothetical protein
MKKAQNSTRSQLKKEVDSWISEDYPKLSALKHPYRSVLLVLLGILLAAFVAALDARSVWGGVIIAVLFLSVAYAHITNTKF